MIKKLVTAAIETVWVLLVPLIGNALSQSVCCFFAISKRAKWQFDDSLDTYPIHGVGGKVGAILTGFFASKEVNEFGNNGLFYGNPGLVVTQLIGVIATYIFAAVGTFIIIKIISAVMDLRVKSIAEDQGIDINEHGEEGYGEEFASGLSLSKE